MIKRNMIKKLIKKYQAYKDRCFAKRLNRVLGKYVIHSSVYIDGELKVTESIHCYVPKSETEEIEAGNKALCI